MSNGGFDGIHQKLLTALEARAPLTPMESRIVPAGDAAWLIELPERIDPAVNARAIAIAARSRRPRLPASATSSSATDRSMVYFDPLRTDCRRVEAAPARRSRPRRRRRMPSPARTSSVPVCYGGEFGPDLADVAAFARCSTTR